MGNRITRNEPNSSNNNLENSGPAGRLLSAISLGSFSGRLNSNLTGSSRSLGSFIRKSRTSKSFNSSLHYSKTKWPIPLTDSIFLSHFKRFSRNEEFQLDSVIENGAFGSVVKVSDKQNTNSVYALKILKKSKVLEEKCVDQVKDEVDIQKLCGHNPFIVKQIDSWQNRRNLYILLEYIPNGDLFDKIYTSFPIDLVRLYVAEIALAIDFLHNAGIIYRDVKPENILLTSDLHLKLTDFGLSKWLKFGNKTQTRCGTLRYMAPEILRGEPYGHEADWWSIGIVACIMLTTKAPNTKTYLEQIFQISNNQNPSQPKDDGDVMPIEIQHEPFLPIEVNDIPKEGQDILQRLLEFNSKFRLKSVMSLQRIALYKNFKIETNSVLEISPLDILKSHNVKIDISQSRRKFNSDDNVFGDF